MYAVPFTTIAVEGPERSGSGSGQVERHRKLWHRFELENKVFFWSSKPEDALCDGQKFVGVNHCSLAYEAKP